MVFFVKPAIMNDNMERQGYMLYFYSEVFYRLANQIHGHICVLLEILFYSMGKLFGFDN